MKYNFVRAFSILAMSILAIQFEVATAPRSMILFGLSSLLIALGFIRGETHKRFGWTLVIDVIAVFAMGYYSRFNINYIVLALNLWIMIEAIVWQPFVRGLLLVAIVYFGIGLTIIDASSYGLNYQNMSQIGLIISLFILFTIMLFMYTSYLNERAQVRKLNTTLTLQNEALVESNVALGDSKVALEEANKEVVRLTRLRERSQFARDLHDTVGHELTGLIMSLEMSKLKAHDSKVTMDEIQQSIDQAREILRAMRSLVDTHKEVIMHDNLYEALSKKLTVFESQTRILVKFTYTLFDEIIDEMVSDALYKAVIESVTNSAKHSSASRIWVSLQPLDSGEILLKVEDNGVLKGVISKGNGLKFIEERIKRIDGSVVFDCDNNGFRTTIKVPYLRRSS